MNLNAKKRPNNMSRKYIFFSVEDNLCVQKCHSEYFFTKKCFINYYSMEAIKETINIIESDIINHSMNDLLLNIIDNGKNDLLMNKDNIIYQITTSYNQNNKEYQNMSTINLGECENILKTIYNIKKEETLIIFKIEYYIKGLLIPIIAYDIFHPNTKKKLDLNHCKNNRINIYIPVSIDENEIYKYDPNSEYYNDICNQTKSSSGTDIILYDRKNEYNIKNMSLCEDNCEFKEYNITSKKVLCICDIKNKSPLRLEDIINKEKLLNNFINMKSISNIEVMKCYKKLFSKNGLIDNIGSYILLSIIFIYIVSSFLFSIKGYNIIITKIENIIRHLKKKKKSNNSCNKMTKDLSIKQPLSSKKNKKPKKNQNKNKNKIKIKISHKKNKIESKTLSKIHLNKKNDLILNINHSQINNAKYTDYELNNFTYEESIKNDKRTYFQYYISLIIRNNLLLFSFIPKDDYNSKIIKICLFFFSFALYFAINTLFFNDSTMHKIYEDEGIFNFIYLIPQMLYSVVISTIIKLIVQKLSLSEKDVLKIKKMKDKNDIEKESSKIIKCLIIKFICFYIITFLLLALFWYYVSCFCTVYKNTQIYLIKDILISFSISLLYPFILCLFPTLLRIISLNKPGIYIYKFSKLIQ